MQETSAMLIDSRTKSYKQDDYIKDSPHLAGVDADEREAALDRAEQNSRIPTPRTAVLGRLQAACTACNTPFESFKHTVHLTLL